MPTVSWPAVEVAVRNWFVAATNLPTIWANQDGPRPEYPYAVLGIDNVRRHARAGRSREVSGTDITYTNSADISFIVTAAVYARAEDASPYYVRSFLLDALMSLESEPQHSALVAANIAVGDALSPINDMTVPYNDTLLQAAQIDIRMHTLATLEDTVSTIGTVELTGTTPAGEELVEVTE